jgi:hypothetical protein
MYMRNPRPSIAREVRSVRIISAPSTAEMQKILASLLIRTVFAAFYMHLTFQDIDQDDMRERREDT